MTILGIIPARMGSSRFPGKPLEKINNKEMLLHVYQNALDSKLIDHLYIATCDEVIREKMGKLNCNVIMTKNTHERCTDRCAEALEKIESEMNLKFDHIVMIQGDEPMIRGEDIDKAIQLLLDDKNIEIANLVGIIDSEDDFNDKNIIKVCINNFKKVIYMSREPIPHSKSFGEVVAYKQVCVMPMKRKTLLLFNQLPSTPLEKNESIDMLRLIENSIDIYTKVINYKTQAVDTKSDLIKVEELLKK